MLLITNRLNLVFVLIVLFRFTCSSQSDEFRPGELWLDNNGKHINAHGGGILFHDGLYFWFGEHKIAGGKGNQAHVGVHVYSSSDLYNWKDDGIALTVHEDSSNALQKGCIIERPKVIYNEATGKFVMWFHHELKGEGYKSAMTGVALADEVVGPYQYLRSVRPNKKQWPQNFSQEQKRGSKDFGETNMWSTEGRQLIKDGLFVRRDFEKGQMSRDMTLFVDHGTAYHIASSEENQTLHVRELNSDYTDFTGIYYRILPGEQNEAPAIFKHNGKFYMISSGLTGWKPNPARLSVADKITGPWKSLGNPVFGSDIEKKTTFYSQSTFVLPVEGKKDTYIFMADRWRPKNAIDGRYIWLPIELKGNEPIVQWYDTWVLSRLD